MPELDQRVARAQAALRDADVDALIAGPSPDLYWLTGYHGMNMERLTLLVVPAEGPSALVVPELEAPRAKASPATEVAELVGWAEDEDPIQRAVELLGRAGSGRIAVQDQLWSGFLLKLQAVLPDAEWVRGATITRELRLVKTSEEVDALRAVGAAIDDVHRRVPDLLRPGRTEHQVGRDIAEAILEEHDEVAFIIVASGPNSASPHHETGDRLLQDGDAIVVDIGGYKDGYCSDMTRTYVLGSAPDGFGDLYGALQEAQEAGVRAVRPGVPAEDIDATCRRILDDAGYGRWFIHRTGHGIGVEVHEEPYLVAGNDEPLRPGMAFSVEPGIYLPDQHGARIEDIVVVTDDGHERMNNVTRELVEVPTT